MSLNCDRVFPQTSTPHNGPVDQQTRICLDKYACWKPKINTGFLISFCLALTKISLKKISLLHWIGIVSPRKNMLEGAELVEASNISFVFPWVSYVRSLIDPDWGVDLRFHTWFGPELNYSLPTMWNHGKTHFGAITTCHPFQLTF